MSFSARTLVTRASEHIISELRGNVWTDGHPFKTDCGLNSTGWNLSDWGSTKRDETDYPSRQMIVASLKFGSSRKALMQSLQNFACLCEWRRQQSSAKAWAISFGNAHALRLHQWCNSNVILQLSFYSERLTAVGNCQDLYLLILLTFWRVVQFICREKTLSSSHWVLHCFDASCEWPRSKTAILSLHYTLWMRIFISSVLSMHRCIELVWMLITNCEMSYCSGREAPYLIAHVIDEIVSGDFTLAVTKTKIAAKWCLLQNMQSLIIACNWLDTGLTLRLVHLLKSKTLSAAAAEHSPLKEQQQKIRNNNK